MDASPQADDVARVLAGQRASTSSTVPALHWATRPTIILRQLAHDGPRSSRTSLGHRANDYTLSTGPRQATHYLSRLGQRAHTLSQL